jgi:hypothetical protein
MGNAVVEGHWLGRAEGLSLGFQLHFAKIMSFQVYSNILQSSDSHGHWIGISSIKHCLLGPYGWEMLW